MPTVVQLLAYWGFVITMAVTPVLVEGRCSVCMIEHSRSTVRLGICTTTAVASPSYYDEDGKYHYDDLNSTACEWVCSRGHRGVSDVQLETRE